LLLPIPAEDVRALVRTVWSLVGSLGIYCCPAPPGALGGGGGGGDPPLVFPSSQSIDGSLPP